MLLRMTSSNRNVLRVAREILRDATDRSASLSRGRASTTAVLVVAGVIVLILAGRALAALLGVSAPLGIVVLTFAVGVFGGSAAMLRNR